MRRRRTNLAERAAAIAAQQPRRRPPTFQDQALLAEIERALAAKQRDVLAALDRLREAAGLPQDCRVARALEIERRVAEIFPSRNKGVSDGRAA